MSVGKLGIFILFATNASFKISSYLESGTVNAGQTRDKYENSDSERSSPVMMLYLMHKI